MSKSVADGQPVMLLCQQQHCRQDFPALLTFFATAPPALSGQPVADLSFDGNKT
ncbi:MULTISPECIES: hypothetical protein [unclassified Erwinia]|uniref:hypothetical protein n=1 Tax=unclassified Erwinia TaxID=2622719 RepID=UPI00130442B4|nr:MULTISPECIES: hypothetical protein [unclassified Erwinia]